MESLKEGLIDGLGGLEEALTYIDELKLTNKAGKGMSGKAVYGMLKQEMWRETVGYLDNFGAEDARDFTFEERRKRDRQESEKEVRAWEIRAKL